MMHVKLALSEPRDPSDEQIILLTKILRVSVFRNTLRARVAKGKGRQET